EDVMPDRIGEKLVGCVVRRRQHGDPPSEHVIEQARQKPSIARVMHVQLVEEEKAAGTGDVVDRALYGVSLAAVTVDAAVQLIEEPVEVNAGLLAHGQRGVERVSQPGLPPAGLTVHVDAASCAPAECAAGQLASEGRQSIQGISLRRIEG